jgi:hypothetical protein
MILSAVAKRNCENGKWIYWWGTRPKTGLPIYIFQAVLSRTIYNILLCSTQVAQSWMSWTSSVPQESGMLWVAIYPCPSSSVAIPTETLTEYIVKGILRLEAQWESTWGWLRQIETNWDHLRGSWSLLKLLFLLIGNWVMSPLRIRGTCSFHPPFLFEMSAYRISLLIVGY